MPAVHAIRNSVLDVAESYPPVVRGQTTRKVGQSARTLRQHAYRLNDLRAGWLTGEWVLRGGGDNFATATNHDLGFKRQSAKEFSTQLCLTDRIADHKGPGRA